MEGTPRERAIARIERENDEGALDRIAKNAAVQGDLELERLALLKLYSVKPSQAPGTFEYDVWRSVYALEDVLSRERNRTTRLGRTRPKIARDGELKTVTELVNGRPSEGFAMLIERDMAEYTFEQLCLRHRDKFDAATLQNAEERLRSVEVLPVLDAAEL